jgi:NitT/TauT family transport system permease protein
MYPSSSRSLYPYAVVIQTIPILALVPLLGFWFGFGFGSRVLVCVLISLFPIIANTLFGLQSVQRGYHDLFTLYRASRRVRLWKLELPAALPAILTGLRISAGPSVIGAIVGDFFFGQGEPGIGILIDVYRARLESERLFAAVILSSLLGVIVFWRSGSWPATPCVGTSPSAMPEGPDHTRSPRPSAPWRRSPVSGSGGSSRTG